MTERIHEADMNTPAMCQDNHEKMLGHLEDSSRPEHESTKERLTNEHRKFYYKSGWDVSRHVQSMRDKVEYLARLDVQIDDGEQRKNLFKTFHKSLVMSTALN